MLSVDPDKLRLAIDRGVVTILPNLRALPAAPQRPYPFERGRRARVAARGSVWNDAGVAALRRQGLICTGEEFARRLAVLRGDSGRHDAEPSDD